MAGCSDAQIELNPDSSAVLAATVMNSADVPGPVPMDPNPTFMHFSRYQMRSLCFVNIMFDAYIILMRRISG
jgi:hypothetical protein